MKEVKTKTQITNNNQKKEEAMTEKIKQEEKNSKKKKGKREKANKLIIYFKEFIQSFLIITIIKVPLTTTGILFYTYHMIKDKNILLKTILEIGGFQIKWFSYIIIAQIIFSWFEKESMKRYKKYNKKRRANILLFFIMVLLIIVNPGGIYTTNTMLVMTTIQLFLAVDQIKEIIR